MNYIKKFCATILILFFAPLVIYFYFLSFEVIKKVDPKIFSLYASNGTSTINPYINDGALKNKAIDDAISQVLEKSGDELKTTQDAYRFFLDNKESVNTVILQNEDYEKYMTDNNLNIDGFWNFAEKMFELDNNIIKAALYICFLIYVLIYYFLFKYRKGIYITVFIVYIITAVNDYSGGLFSYALYPLLVNLLSETEILTISDFSILFSMLFPALKEAILTYILLDTVWQIKVDKKYSENVFLIREILYSLEKMQQALRQYQGGEFVITKLRIKFYPLKRIIIRKQKKDENSKELLKFIDEFENDEFAEEPIVLLSKINRIIYLMENNYYLKKYLKY